MKAIVTGGAGFIGSNLVDSLVRGGYEVVAIDDLSRGSADNLSNALANGASLAELDVRNGRELCELFDQFRPDVVFHLAAQVRVTESMEDPAHDASVNVLGAINVLEASRRSGARRVVNTSTGGAIYGTTLVLPTPETSPALPLSAYGLSKQSAETYASWYSRERSLDVVTLRYGNVYGPRQDPSGDAGVIAIFCDALLSGRPLTIYGDGQQTRDYVYVGDIVSANITAAEATTLAYDVYNIGNATETSVLDLASAIAEVVGIDAKIDHIPARPGEVIRSCLDVTRARAELGPTLTRTLQSGVADTVAWLRSRN